MGQFSDLRILLYPDMLEGIFIFKASGAVSVGSILKVKIHTTKINIEKFYSEILGTLS